MGAACLAPPGRSHDEALRFARFVTEVSAPWLTNIVLFLALGISLGAPAPGLLAASMTGIVPMLAILLMMKRGQVGDHHVTIRHQRGAVFLVIMTILALLIGGLYFLETPRALWVAVVAAVSFILVYSLITRFVAKISVHVGLWVAVWIYLGYTLGPAWWLGLLATPVIAWSRRKLTHHSWQEIVGGVLAGLAVAGGVLPLI